MTKESFISICWRLIPYWLNNWEQQWGAECSSMMFELPHFAMELLVVLPCVQVSIQCMRGLLPSELHAQKRGCYRALSSLLAENPSRGVCRFCARGYGFWHCPPGNPFGQMCCTFQLL